MDHSQMFVYRTKPSSGFSLLEMSVVVVIISLVAVMGLEATSIYLGRTALTATRDKLAVIDAALQNYYHVTGRLPCPADRTLAENYSGASTYGFENCTSPTSIYTGVVQVVGIKNGGTGYTAGSIAFNNTGTSGAGAAATYTVTGGVIDPTTTIVTPGAGYATQPAVSFSGGAGAVGYAGTNTVYFGWVPVAELGLPVSAGIDAYGGRINYVVTQGLTNAYTFAATTANIEVRSGLLKQPCNASGVCQVLADPNAVPPSGAAFVVFSHGPDQRGAISRSGGVIQPCLIAPSTSYDLAIDSQNCAAITGSSSSLDTGSIGGTIPTNVFYDSRFNANSGVEANKYDDIMIWRTKGRL